MPDRGLLGAAALGDLAALLPGTALADAAGAIRPDPDARPRRREPQEPFHRVPDDPERAPRSWAPDLVSVTAICVAAGLQASADAAGRRQAFSPALIRIAKGDAFRIDVYFHVDADAVPRPLPFQPPQVGLQYYFTLDGGEPSETLVLWDPAPTYLGPGQPLRPRFSTAIGFATPLSGWLNLSGRITDRQADVELDQAVRIEVQA